MRKKKVTPDRGVLLISIPDENYSDIVGCLQSVGLASVAAAATGWATLIGWAGGGLADRLGQGQLVEEQQG